MNKKKISLIMSFILIFSLIVPVFAETILVDTGNKSENIKNEINIDENNNKDLLINNDSLNSEITIDNSNNLEEIQSGQGNKGEEPAQDFNEEIVEFKQYVRDITNDSNSKFSEHINYEQNKDKENIVEHMFTLKTKPLSRDYAAGELKIMPLGFERNNKMFKELGISDNAFFNTIEEYPTKSPIHLIETDSFEIKEDTKNPLNFFIGNSYLTNKNTLQKGQTLDISYKYQEYLFDFFITNNSEIQEKTLINSNEYLGSKIKYKNLYIKNIEKEKLHSYFTESKETYEEYVNNLYQKITNDKYEYASIDLSNYNKFSAYIYHYDKGNETKNIVNKEAIFRKLDPINFVETNNYNKEIFSYLPRFIFPSHKANLREPLLYTGLNGTYPKLTFTADCPLIYVDKNGKKESFNPGDEITIIENGEPKRFFGDLYDYNNRHTKRCEQLEGSFFVKRDLDKVKTITLNFNLYNTRYKDEDRLFNIKNFCNIDYHINEYPKLEKPQIIKFSQRKTSSTDYLLEDLFLNNNKFGYVQSLKELNMIYKNKSLKAPLKDIPFYLQGMLLYNKNDINDNKYFDTNYQYSVISANNFPKYTLKDDEPYYFNSLNDGNFLDISDGLKSFRKKIENNPYKKYKIKFIFKLTDTAGENNKPFFKNIKDMDISNNLKAFNNSELNNIIKNIDSSPNDILCCDLDKNIIDYPAVHIFQCLSNSRLKFINGKIFGDYVKFNVSNLKLTEAAILPNDLFLNSVDDDTIFEYNFAFPEGFICNGKIKTSMNTGFEPQIVNIDDYSIVKIKFTKNDLLKYIEKRRLKSEIINLMRDIDNPYLFTISCNGDVLAKRNKFKNISSSNIFNVNTSFKDSFKIYSKTKIPFKFINNSIEVEKSSRQDFAKLYSDPIEKIIDKNTIEFSYEPIKFFEEFAYTINNYCEATPSPEFVAGIINTIKGPTDTDFTLSPQKIDYSALYQNKISVQTASTPMTDTTIFYDVENAKPKFVNWKGILKGIDVSNIEKQGYKVEIHSNEETYSKDLSEKGWHLFESTQDLSKIKSLAFKILDKNNKAAVLPEETLFSIILNMQVPEESKVSKVDGKPTHSYSNVYAQWRGTNESEVHGIHSETVKLSLKDSIVDDIEAKGNHQIIVEREYIGTFSENKKNLNRIVILKGRNNNKEYKIYKDKIGFVEPDIYDIEYITSKDVEISKDSTKEVEVKKTFEDSLDKIKVKYQIKKNINNGYTDSDQKENLYAIKLK